MKIHLDGDPPLHDKNHLKWMKRIAVIAGMKPDNQVSGKGRSILFLEKNQIQVDFHTVLAYNRISIQSP
jgi:hypothetical protein